MRIGGLMSKLSGFTYFTKGSQNVCFAVKKGEACRPVETISDLFSAWFKWHADQFFQMPKTVAQYIYDELGDKDLRAHYGNSWVIVYSDESPFLIKLGESEFSLKAIETNMNSLNHLNKTSISACLALPEILDYKRIGQWKVLKESKLDLTEEKLSEEQVLESIAGFHQQTMQKSSLRHELVRHSIQFEKGDKLPSFVLAKVESKLEEINKALFGKSAVLSQIHGDFWDGNVYKTKFSQIGLIDFDRSIGRSFAEFDIINYYYNRELNKIGNNGRNSEKLLTSLSGDPERFAHLKNFVKKYYQYNPELGETNEELLFEIVQLFVIKTCCTNIKVLGFSMIGLRYVTRVNNILKTMMKLKEIPAFAKQY